MAMSADPPESALVAPLADLASPSVILGLLPDAVLILDGEGRVEWGNRAAEELFGVAHAEAVGRSALEFIHPDDVEFVLRSLASVQEKEIGALIELRVATQSGWRLVEVIGRCVPEFGSGHVLFCIRDVTERRRFEVARDDVEKFRSLVHNAAFVTMHVDTNATIESVSAAMTRLFGHDPENVEGRRLAELFAPGDYDTIENALESAGRHDRSSAPVTLEVSCRHHSGAFTPVELTIVSLRDDPTVDGFVVSMRDVSELALAERELREALSLLSATLESTADGILVVDTKGKIVSCNQRFAELWNIPDDMLDARDDAKAVAYVTSQLVDPAGFVSKVGELYASPDAESFDTLVFLDGRVLERFSRPQRVGEEIVGRVLSFRDVTERKRLEESLAHRAYHDSLTGLPNKDLFLERLQLAVDRSDRARVVAVLFIDVDGLKLVNDRFGHDVGDQLLVKVATELQGRVSAENMVARLGGDEFVVLAEDLVDHAEAATLAERILDGLPANFSVGEVELEISISLGISFVEPGVSHLEVLRNADAAMYSAKQRGRGRWELHAPSVIVEPPADEPSAR